MNKGLHSIRHVVLIAWGPLIKLYFRGYSGTAAFRIFFGASAIVSKAPRIAADGTGDQNFEDFGVSLSRNYPFHSRIYGSGCGIPGLREHPIEARSIHGPGLRRAQPYRRRSNLIAICAKETHLQEFGDSGIFRADIKIRVLSCQENGGVVRI